MDDDCGTVLEASRINHSCASNNHFSWNTYVGRETIHAVLNIRQGNEIIASNIHPHQDVHHRQFDLRANGFECRCDNHRHDKSASRESEARRCQMIDVLDAIIYLKETPLRPALPVECSKRFRAQREMIRLREE